VESINSWSRDRVATNNIKLYKQLFTAVEEKIEPGGFVLIEGRLSVTRFMRN